MNRSEDGMFALLIRKSVRKRNPRKGWHSFTVFGKAVLFGEVIEPERHGLVEDSKTVPPRVSAAFPFIRCNINHKRRFLTG